MHVMQIIPPLVAAQEDTLELQVQRLKRQLRAREEELSKLRQEVVQVREEQREERQ